MAATNIEGIPLWNNQKGCFFGETTNIVRDGF